MHGPSRSIYKLQLSTSLTRSVDITVISAKVSYEGTQAPQTAKRILSQVHTVKTVTSKACYQSPIVKGHKKAVAASIALNDRHAKMARGCLSVHEPPYLCTCACMASSHAATSAACNLLFPPPVSIAPHLMQTTLDPMARAQERRQKQLWNILLEMS